MGGTEPADPVGRPEIEPEAEAVAAPRLAVVMGKQADVSRICRVDAPDRVLRIWAMLSTAEGDLNQSSLPPETTRRLRRQLDAIIAELERSLSPALAGELHRIIDRDKDTEPTADELRVEYAALLAWTIALVIGILSQIEAEGAKIARHGLQPRPIASH
jgi:hypothetical protein